MGLPFETGRLLGAIAAAAVLACAVGALAGTAPRPAGLAVEEIGACRFAAPEQIAGVGRELGRVCGAEAERIFAQVGAEWPSGSGPAIEVRVVSDPEDMDGVVPSGSPPPWSDAVAYPDLDLVVLSLHRRDGRPIEDLETVLEHEISHLALRKALGGARVPRWFSEGVAVLQSEGSSLARSGALWWASLGGELLSLEEMERYPGSPGRVGLAYAQAADFVGYLVREEGWAGIREVVERAAEGAPFADAVRGSYGRSVRDLEASWRRALSRRWGWIAVGTGSGALWGAMTVLFVAAYLAVRRRRRERLARMAAEEDAVQHLIDVMSEIQAGAGRDRGGRMDRVLPIDPPEGESRTKVLVDGDFHTLH